jgi:hypothetical protein
VKVTFDVRAGSVTLYVQTFYDLPASPLTGRLLSGEIERLMVAYPAYQTITVEIEKDEDDATTTETNVQEPPRSERSEE